MLRGLVYDVVGSSVVCARVGSVSRWGRGYSCGLLLLEFSDHSALQLIVSMGSLGPFVFGTPCFPDQVCQGLYACLCAEECCALVAWGSFVDYVPVFFVGLAFEYYVFRCLEFCAAWESDALLYVMRLAYNLQCNGWAAYSPFSCTALTSVGSLQSLHKMDRGRSSIPCAYLTRDGPGGSVAIAAP